MKKKYKLCIYNCRNKHSSQGNQKDNFKSMRRITLEDTTSESEKGNLKHV